MSEILKALKQFGGNKTKTAEYLGINRKTLREKIRKMEIEERESSSSNSKKCN